MNTNSSRSKRKVREKKKDDPYEWDDDTMNQPDVDDTNGISNLIAASEYTTATCSCIQFNNTSNFRARPMIIDNTSDINEDSEWEEVAGSKRKIKTKTTSKKKTRKKREEGNHSHTQENNHFRNTYFFLHSFMFPVIWKPQSLENWGKENNCGDTVFYIVYEVLYFITRKLFPTQK